jgi:alpha-L-fucosidase 2
MDQCYPQLFAKCYTPLQVDGSLGVTAGIAEMLIQSHEGVIDLLPALPDDWSDGSFNGVCARGAFELKFTWKTKVVTSVEIFSKAGQSCRIHADRLSSVTENGKKVKVTKYPDGSLEFDTEPWKIYKLGKD